MTDQLINEQIRLDILHAKFRKLMLDFPVVRRAEVSARFSRFGADAINKTVERLVAEGFIRVVPGERRGGGVRYVRNSQTKG